MQIIKVTDSNHDREFIQLAVRLYQNDPNWIRPLDQDIIGLFNPDTNKLFKLGAQAARWLLVNDQQLVVGRIAAFTNPKCSESQPTGGIGFFECIDNQSAAFKLFDTARQWLQDLGMQAMDGPINFGERDKWWGLLVDGFYEPNYATNYNFDYYQYFFESYGFQIYFKQYTYMRPVKNVSFDDKMVRRAQVIDQNPNYTFRHLTRSEIKSHAPAYFKQVYNQAWSKLMGKTLSHREVQLLFNKMQPIIDKRLIYFGFYKGEPVSFFIQIPEINQLIKHVNGKMNVWGKLKFLWYKTVAPPDKMLGLVFGVIPSHQGKGVESAMIINYDRMSSQPSFKYQSIEMNWIGDFNPKMMHVCEQLNAQVYKTHHTYRYLFDRNIPFKRHKIL